MVLEDTNHGSMVLTKLGFDF